MPATLDEGTSTEVKNTMTTTISNVAVSGDATASGISATPPDSETSSSVGVMLDAEIPSTSSRSSGQLDNIADRLSTLMTTIDSAGFVSMSKEELTSCTDIELLRQQGLSLRVRNEMLQIQNQLLDFERRSRLENRGISGVTAAENDPATAMLAFKEELYRKILSVIETEFNCCICSEVFIEPTVLECGHTFCMSCITQWLHDFMHERHQCPVCRNPTNYGNRPVKHVEMNNFLTRIYVTLSDEIRQRRDQQIRDRQTTLADSARRAHTIPAYGSSTNNPGIIPPFHHHHYGIGIQDYHRTNRERDQQEERLALYRRLSDQLTASVAGPSPIASSIASGSGLGRFPSVRRHIAIPRQTARRGRHISSTERHRGIDEYMQQQRILARFQDLVRRREMEAEIRANAAGSSASTLPPVQPFPPALARSLVSFMPPFPQPPSAQTSSGGSGNANVSSEGQGQGSAAASVASPRTSLQPVSQANNGTSSAGGNVPAAGPSAPTFMDTTSSFDLGLGTSSHSIPRAADLPPSITDTAASMTTSELRRELTRRGGQEWNAPMPMPMPYQPRRSSRNRIPTAAEIMAAQLSDFDSEEDQDIIPME